MHQIFQVETIKWKEFMVLKAISHHFGGECGRVREVYSSKTEEETRTKRTHKEKRLLTNKSNSINGKKDEVHRTNKRNGTMMKKKSQISSPR